MFKLPEPYIPEEVAVVLGTDGKRKMSKTLGNIISIFDNETVIKKQVMSTYTDPSRIHADDPGHIEGNMVFTYLDFFGEKEKVEELKGFYRKGKVPDVEVKNYLFESLMKFFRPARELYSELSTNPDKVKKILQDGAKKAREVCKKTMTQARDAIGLTNRNDIFEDGNTVEKLFKQKGLPYFAMSNAIDLLPQAYHIQRPGVDIARKVEQEFMYQGIKRLSLL